VCQRLGGFGVSGIIDDDGKAVGSQALGNRRADAARGARNDRYLVGFACYFMSPLGFAACPRSMGAAYILPMVG
jgi:hypothetical protein